MSLHMLGADAAPPNLDYADLAGRILNAGGQVAEVVMAKVDADKAAASAEDKLRAAVAADLAATVARAAACSAAEIAIKTPGKAKAAADAKARAAKTAADVASAAQDAAGAKVPDDAAPKREEEAQRQLTSAIAKLQGSPEDIYARCLVDAWRETLAKAQHGQIVTKVAKDPVAAVAPSPKPESWLTKKVVGPIPGYGVALGGVGVAGLGWLAFKKNIFARVFGG